MGSTTIPFPDVSEIQKWYSVSPIPPRPPGMETGTISLSAVLTSSTVEKLESTQLLKCSLPKVLLRPSNLSTKWNQLVIGSIKSDPEMLL